MKRLALLLGCLLCVLPAAAHAADPPSITFEAPLAATLAVPWGWDAALDGRTHADSAADPLRYWFYLCTDSGLTQCTQFDAGTATSFTSQFPLGSSGSYWVYVTARWHPLIVDGVPQGEIAETGKSNVPAVRVTSPPGNPANTHVKVTNP